MAVIDTIDMSLPDIVVLLRTVADALWPHLKALEGDDKAELATVVYHSEKARECLIDFLYNNDYH